MTETDTRTFGQKFKANVTYFWRYATAWVTGLWTSIFAFWSGIDSVTQQNYLGWLMNPKYVGPIIAVLGFISYFVAHGWPQPSLAKKIETTKTVDQIADSKMMGLKT